jgi:hypothetical protein
MTPDDTPIPNDDPIARAARRGLGEIAGTDAPGELSWEAVQSGARRIRQRRLTALVAACAIVIVAASAALAAGRNDDSHVRVAGGPAPTSTSTPTTPPTESLSEPGAADVTGMIAVGSPPTDVQPPTLTVGRSVTVTSVIWNVSDHPIWTSSVSVPGRYATVCTSESTRARSLWWMTNVLLAPGNKTARSGTFTPTDAYVGTVTCELDLVVFDEQKAFDTGAGGDAAHGTILAPVPGVKRVTLQVVPARWKVTKTGRVGPLQLGVSTEAEVRAEAGAPDRTGRGTFGVTGYPDFQALGYDCADQAAADRISMHPQPNTTGPYCRTVFYMNANTGTLAGFETTSNRYETENGVAVGTSSVDAGQREGQAPGIGCFVGIRLGGLATGPYELFIWVGTQPTDAVSSLSAEAASNQVGLMFC